ncbi:MAG: NfeD family protein [Halalkalicoccus sp.]
MVEILGESLPLVPPAAALAPGAHLIVLGVALLVAGLVGLALGPFVAGGALAVVLALTVLSVGGVSLFAYRELDIYGGKGAGKTSDSASLKGRTGRVTERVSPTGGQIKLTGGGFNPYYTARSLEGEIEEGEEVFVIDPGGGNVLTVESMGVVEDEIDRELNLGRVTDAPEATNGERESEYDLEK